MLSFVEQGKERIVSGQRLHLVLGCIEFQQSWSSRQAIGLLCLALSESMKNLKVEAWGLRGRKGPRQSNIFTKGEERGIGWPRIVT